MPVALDDAIMAKLQTCAALAAILAKDPQDETGSDLAVFPTFLNDVKKPVYPCITYREQDDVPDDRFRPQPAGTPKKGVSEAFFNFEGWTDQPNRRVLRLMRDALDALFHQQAFPIPDAVNPTAAVFYCERLTSAQDDHDKELHTGYALMRYRFRVAAF